MSSGLGAVAVKNLVLIEQISQAVYQALVSIQQQRPEWLIERRKTVSLQQYQTLITTKLNELLASVESSDTLGIKLKQFLNYFLVPEFFELAEYGELLKQINLLFVDDIKPLNDLQQLPAISLSVSVDNEVPQKDAIAVILLDAENLQLGIAAEEFLAKTCRYPIQVKIAFANWRKMGKQDAELHQRGYDLIHVPAGQDHADGKMIAVGSSLREHYAHAKEVLVCSSDTVMMSLCNKLQQQGLTVYLVKKQGDHLTVRNNQTSKTKTFSLVPLPEIPPLNECVAQLKSLIKAEQQRAAVQWVKLSKISELFKQKHQVRLSQVATKYLPGKKVKELFTDHSTDFVTHQLPDESDVYITLFDNSYPAASNSQSDAPVLENPNKAPQENGINSKNELEQILLALMQSLLAQSSESRVKLSILGVAFHQQHSQPITQVIKSLEPSSNFPKFLQSSKLFKLERKGNEYWVAIAK